MHFKSIFCFVAFALVVSSCSKEDPIIPNEEEVITTLKYFLTPTNGGETVVLSFTDLDGDGGAQPVIVGGTLNANSTYNGSIELSNEQNNPSEDITAEVREEGDEHQFFFSSTLASINITYKDTDVNGLPVGLSTELVTNDAGSGMITFVLRHEPNKTAAGVSGGDITNAGGETDIEVSINIDVQ